MPPRTMTSTPLVGRRVRSAVALTLVGFLLAGCNAMLTTFLVPATVGAGRTFVVFVEGQPQGSNTGSGFVGCVLQLPLGFTVVARGPGTPDESRLLQKYTVEPGHWLVSQSGVVGSVMTAGTHFVVRAPANVGTFTCKVSVAGHNGTPDYTAVDPPGVTDFAQITAATHVRSLVVQPVSPEPFAPEPSPLPPDNGRTLLVDIDRDGSADVVRGPGPRVLLARPGGTWLDRSPAPVPPPSQTIAVGDFDGDGHLDLVHGSRTVFYGDGAGGWTVVPLLPATPNPVATLAAGDADGDGRDDVLECDTTGWVRCLSSRTNRTFVSRSFGLPGSGTVQGQLATADVDGDGNGDLVGTTGLWRGLGNGTWTLAWTPNTQFSQVHQFAIGDLYGDARPEVVLLRTSATQPDLLRATAQGFASSVAFGRALLYRAAAIADLDGDGVNEVVLGGDGIEVWSLPLGLANARPDLGLPARLGCTLNASPAVGEIVVGDFEGDGRIDVVTGSGLPSDWSPLAWRNVGAGAQPYGAACTAPAFAAPTFAANGAPTLGNAAFGLDLGGGPAQGIGLVWLGLSRHTRFGQPVLPLSLTGFGATGCTLLAEDLALHFVPLGAAGAASWPLPLPAAPWLHLVTLFAQGAVLQSGANPLGLLTTRALAVRID
jgi:hypothetical protein